MGASEAQAATGWRATMAPQDVAPCAPDFPRRSMGRPPDPPSLRGGVVIFYSFVTPHWPRLPIDSKIGFGAIMFGGT